MKKPKGIWLVDGCRLVSPDGLSWRSDHALYKAAETEAHFIADACNAAPKLVAALTELLAASDPARGRGTDRELNARSEAVKAIKEAFSEPSAGQK